MVLLLGFGSMLATATSLLVPTAAPTALDGIDFMCVLPALIMRVSIHLTHCDLSEWGSETRKCKCCRRWPREVTSEDEPEAVVASAPASPPLASIAY